MTEPVLQRAIDETMHESLRAARLSSPTAVDADTGAVVVLRYDEVERLSHDPRVLGVGLSFFDFMGIGDSDLRRWYGSLMFTNEGDVHRRLRRLVARAFTPRSVERLRTFAREGAEARLARLVHRGGGDLVATFADLPMAVMCRLLGVPDGEVARFAGYGDALSPVFGLMDAEQIEAAADALGALTDDVAAVVRERQRDRGDDLISDLLSAEEGGDRLTHDELLTMVGNLIVGGHDTTASQIGCTLLTLTRHAEALALAADGAVEVADVVNESIRFEPSIAFVPRTLAAPAEIGGVERPAGSMVFLSSASANRDEGAWDEPDAFRAGRFASPGVARLLSFGAGPHYCLGAAAARMTIEAVVSALAPVADDLVCDADDVAWREVLGRSPESLPVRARAAAC